MFHLCYFFFFITLNLRKKRGGLVVQVSFKSAAIALLSFARWRRYIADSALLWRMT